MGGLKDWLYICTVGLLIASTEIACSQSKKISGRQRDKFDLSLLVGSWQSEADSTYILQFDKLNMVMINLPNTTRDPYPYRFSGSCDLKDTLADLKMDNTHIIVLIEEDFQFCYDVGNISEETLSFINIPGGKIESFYRIAERGK